MSIAHGRERGRALVQWARACVRETFGGPTATPPNAAWCGELGATFVSLRWRDGQLQGCIGTLRPVRSIVSDVAYNAVAAATRDDRGVRLALPDVDELDIEVSILSALEPITVTSEAAMRAAIRVGSDGLVFEHANRRATLLPTVWKHVADLDTFIAVLKRKAGLPRDFWSDDIRVSRYSTEHHVERAADLRSLR
jgi:AmmeMemoRadiSam system protein A